jgi:uncharacterized membrane protein
MTRLLKQKYWHELFEAGIALKAFNSVWETAGGILLLTGLHSWLSRGFVFITSSVFFAERHEFLFHILDVQLRHLNVVSTRTFVGAYLLFHGIMNAFFGVQPLSQPPVGLPYHDWVFLGLSGVPALSTRTHPLTHAVCYQHF